MSRRRTPTTPRASASRYLETKFAKSGDLGSYTLQPRPTGTVWQAGGVANVSWYIAFNHGGGCVPEPGNGVLLSFLGGILFVLLVFPPIDPPRTRSPGVPGRTARVCRFSPVNSMTLNPSRAAGGGGHLISSPLPRPSPRRVCPRYKYRICPRTEQLTEECFQRPEHQLEFASDEHVFLFPDGSVTALFIDPRA